MHSTMWITMCVLALIPACRRQQVPLDKCGIVHAILEHRAAVPGETEWRRSRAVDDPCIRDLALFHGKALVDTTVDGRRAFAASEGCPTFEVHDPTAKVPDLPEAVIVLELTQSGRNAFQWHWWVNSILNPSGGACAPGRGRVEFRENLGRWQTLDVPPEPYVP